MEVFEGTAFRRAKAVDSVSGSERERTQEEGAEALGGKSVDLHDGVWYDERY